MKYVFIRRHVCGEYGSERNRQPTLNKNLSTLVSITWFQCSVTMTDDFSVCSAESTMIFRHFSMLSREKLLGGSEDGRIPITVLKQTQRPRGWKVKGQRQKKKNVIHIELYTFHNIYNVYGRFRKTSDFPVQMESREACACGDNSCYLTFDVPC